MTTDPFNYLESRDDADGLIDDFGAAALVRRTINTGTDFDPVQTSTDYATLAVRVEFTVAQRMSGNVIANTERWLVAAGPLTALGVTSLAAPDALVVNGQERPVLKSEPLAPAGVTVMYDCQIGF